MISPPGKGYMCSNDANSFDNHSIDDHHLLLCISTSGRSTKLIHGGIRYLETAFKKFDYGSYALVKVSCCLLLIIFRRVMATVSYSLK